MNQFNQQQVTQIQKIVDDEIKKKLFQYPKIPPHTHDGVDNVRINRNNLLQGNKFTGFVEVTPGNAPTNTLTITGVNNPTSVSFYGIGYYLPDFKCMITGNAQLGIEYQLTGNGSSSNTNTNLINGVVQANCSTFFEKAAGVWTPTVDADNVNLAAIYNTGSTLIGNIQVVSFTNSSVTLQAPLAANWTIQGSIIIT